MRFPDAVKQFLVATAFLAAWALGQGAAAQCPPDACAEAAKSIWLGDLNNDGLVNDDDVQFYSRCIADSGTGTTPPYCAAADLNFDGVNDTTDLNYLSRVVDMARDATIKKLPKVAFSEVRTRKPPQQTNPVIPQTRYVEFLTPIGAASPLPTSPPAQVAAPTVNQVLVGDPATIRRFGPGWFYIKVCRSTAAAGPTDMISGTIAVVEALDGMAWVSNPLDSTSRGLSLLADATFGSPVADAVPAGVVPLIQPAASSLAVPGLANGRRFTPETDTNVTHLVVFRDPAGPRAAPAVGQRVNVPTSANPNTLCDLAWTVPSATPTLPPWDAIVTAITIVRGVGTSEYGCIYAEATGASIGPIGSLDSSYSPMHIYRCRTAGTLTRGNNSCTTTSDTPFARNPSCTASTSGCGELNPDGTVRDCFLPQDGKGCSDADCCGAVCQLDPTCCSESWDTSCVNQALLTCRSCGTNPASCFEVHPTPSCTDPACCEQVCQSDPACCSASWDEGCVELAGQLCLSCGKAATGDCLEVHPLPYCADATCCATVCNVDPLCCSSGWDQACVDIAQVRCVACGGPTTGDCCVIHASPYCNDSTCCSAVCGLDPYCCETSWDLSCTQLALVNPSCAAQNCACGQPTAGSCFAIHATPGCSDAFCCQLVCQRDPYCCAVNWDRSCRSLANDTCATNAACLDPVTGLPVVGSCFIPHLTPGCDRPGCCSQVCADAAYAYCCNVAWDEQCAIRASAVCDTCGDPLSGSCFQEHGTPRCADGSCCNTVCGVDPFCCSEAWDGLCVTIAQARCPSPVAYCGSGNSRSCWIPNFTPGCSDSTCCRSICTNIDPYCCEARWDAVCAREAGYLCTPQGFVVTIGREGCLTPHASAGCANADCSRAVCSVDPACCTTAWDARCVDIASAVCVAPDACPSTGDCFALHSGPGCQDPACCNAVCAIDPSCCNGAWDAACVSTARTACKVPPGSDWPCPCLGECTETHDNPGCSDGSCCAIVCNLDPSCCTQTWDSNCAGFAREYCCGPVGCGSGCNGDCLVVHDTPYCNDPYCCDSVCRADPLCCAENWDSMCVATAYERCASACGLDDAGNCWAEHELPGCKDGRCCGRICTTDPACCTVTWDANCVTAANATVNAPYCKIPKNGDFNAGEPCTPHDNPATTNKPCGDAVCLQDTYCCQVEWDASCVDIAVTIDACNCTYDCGDACAGSCCRAHANANCDNADCCKVVCAQDNYCCTVEWDAVCASMARTSCNGEDEACPVPPCGSDLLASCCVISPLPNCADQTCCDAICRVDQYCCTVQWDLSCVQQARSGDFPQCKCDDGGCGSPNAGSCFQTHPTPSCSDLGCCQTVCAFEPTCCENSWDANCVSIANFFCGGGFTGLTDAYGGRKPDAGGRVRTPPKGWVPPRERAKLRQPPKQVPPGMPQVPSRKPEGAAPIPRTDATRGGAMPEPEADEAKPAKPSAGTGSK